MANQTVTSDVNLSQIIGDLNNGQNITINDGATVTVDDGSLTKLIGTITINNGKFLWDGANAVNPLVHVGEEGTAINVNGAGVLESTRGWWEFPITSTGLPSQVFDSTTYFQNSLITADVFSGVWVETGRRINYTGGSAIAPFDAMTFERFSSPQAQTGFNQGSLDYTDVIANPNGGSLAEVRAYLDRLMEQDTDQDIGTGSFIPRRADPLYTIDNQGRLVTRQGLYIANLPASDLQTVVQTSDNGTTGTYPFEPELRFSVTDAWVNDPNAWAQAMYVDGSGSLDFETGTAVIVQDSAGGDMVFTPANAQGTSGGYFISVPYAYDTNTQAGLSAGVDKACVFLAEGDGGATADNAFFTIRRETTIPVTVSPQAETNI